MVNQACSDPAASERSAISGEHRSSVDNGIPDPEPGRYATAARTSSSCAREADTVAPGPAIRGRCDFPLGGMLHVLVHVADPHLDGVQRWGTCRHLLGVERAGIVAADLRVNQISLYPQRILGVSADIERDDKGKKKGIVEG